MENDDIYQCIIKIVQRTRQPESLMLRHQRAVEANLKMGWIDDYGLVPNPPLDHVYNSPTGILVICFKYQDEKFHKRHDITIGLHLSLRPDIIKSCCSELNTNSDWLGICDELDKEYRAGWEWIELELFANNGRAPASIWSNPKTNMSYAVYSEIFSALTFMLEEMVEIIKISGISICLSGYVAIRISPDSDNDEIDETCTLRLSYKDGGLHLSLIRGSEEVAGNYCPTAKRLSA